MGALPDAFLEALQTFNSYCQLKKEGTSLACCAEVFVRLRHLCLHGTLPPTVIARTEELLSLDSTNSFEKKQLRRFKRFYDLQQCLDTLLQPVTDQSHLKVALNTLSNILLKPRFIYKSRFDEDMTLLINRLTDLSTPLEQLTKSNSLFPDCKAELAHTLAIVNAWVKAPEEMRFQPAYHEPAIVDGMRSLYESLAPTDDLQRFRTAARNYCQRVLEDPKQADCHLYRRSMTLQDTSEKVHFVRTCRHFPSMEIRNLVITYRPPKGPLNGSWEITFQPELYNARFKAIATIALENQAKVSAIVPLPNKKIIEVLNAAEKIPPNSEVAIEVPTLAQLENLFQKMTGPSFPLIPQSDPNGVSQGDPQVGSNFHCSDHVYWLEDRPDYLGNYLSYLIKMVTELKGHAFQQDHFPKLQQARKALQESNKKSVAWRDELAQAPQMGVPCNWDEEKEVLHLYEKAKKAFFERYLVRSLDRCSYLICKDDVTSLFALAFRDPSGHIHQHTLNIDTKERRLYWKGQNFQIEDKTFASILEILYPGTLFVLCAQPKMDDLSDIAASLVKSKSKALFGTYIGIPVDLYQDAPN